MVSIFMITYNHEKYLEEALDSIIMQKTNFKFDIVVGEDFSTDNTRKILLKYYEKYPSEFKLLLHQKNVGAMQNQIETLKACTGKYIAMCEGDDYWTDPLKLQKQVDFLEENEDYCLTHHKAGILKEGKISEDHLNKNTEETTTLYDLSKHNYLRTPTVLFRNPKIKIFPEYLLKSTAGDYPLYILVLDEFKHKIKYFNKIMGVYRIHEQGLWETRPMYFRLQRWGETLEFLIKHFNKEDFSENFRNAHHQNYWELYLRETNDEKAIKFLKQSLKYSDFNVKKILHENAELSYIVKRTKSKGIYKWMSLIKGIIKNK